MPTENAGLRILYLGNDGPGMESLKLHLLDYFKSPVFIHYARSGEDFEALLSNIKLDVLVAEDEPGVISARLALDTARMRCPGVPLIVLTGAPVMEAAALIRLGAADCVAKGDAGHLRFAVIREIEKSIRSGSQTAAEYAEARRADFIGLLLSLAKNCINVSIGRLPEVICSTLEQIAEYCDADRIVSYVLDWKTNAARRHYEWNRLAEFHSAELVETLDISDLGEALDILLQGRVYVGGGPDTLLDSVLYSRADAKPQEGALCAFPAFISNKLRGVIMVSAVGRSKKWSLDEMASFQICSELIVGMMQRIEEELRHDEETQANALILDALNEAVVLFDRDGIVLRANTNFAERFGMTPVQIKGADLNEYFPDGRYGDLVEKRMAALNHTFDSGAATKLIDERDGRFYHNRYYPVFEKDAVSSVAMISTDITERMLLQHETLKNAVLEKEAQLLREKERELLEILDTAADASIIADCVSNAVQYSSKLLRLLSYENVPVDNLPALMESLILPEDRDAVHNARNEAIRKRESTLETEFRVIYPEGNIRWLHSRGKFIFDQDRNPVKYFATFNDITERRAAEAAQQESELRTNALVEELKNTKTALTSEVEALRRLHSISSEHILQNDLIHIYNEILDATIEIANCGKGYMQLYVQKENCLKMIAHRGFGPRFLERFAVVHVGQPPGGAALEKRSRVVYPDTGDPVIFSEAEITLYEEESVRCVQATPMISGSGMIYGVLCTCCGVPHDLTERELRHIDLLSSRAADLIERKRNEVALEISEKNATALVEALKRADSSKNQFLNQLSHELRNPLATIGAATSLIELSDDLTQIREMNTILKSEAKQLSRLVDDLLDVTRFTTNKIKLRKEWINLTEVVRSSANNFMPRFRERSVGLTVETGGTGIFLYADPARIMQIIENLLTNALKYTDDGGDVVMSLWDGGDAAVISVKDNGIGIHSEEMPRLFNAFYQSERSPYRAESGLGLGLSIVKAIAELHGGKVGAFSAGVGTGATFTVTLPLSGAPENGPPLSV